MVAETRTGVLTVPAWTIVCANPVPSEKALVAVRASPPAVVLAIREKLTLVPAMTCPVLSSTWKTTTDVSLLPAPPVPLRAMFVGVAEPAAIAEVARGLARLFERRPGVTFLSEVEVIRSDYFAGAAMPPSD